MNLKFVLRVSERGREIRQFVIVKNKSVSIFSAPGWENLDRGQYPFRPIKFVNLVVPSPCETEPYNKVEYYTPINNSDSANKIEIVVRVDKSDSD